jgi:hypothetical protein
MKISLLKFFKRNRNQERFEVSEFLVRIKTNHGNVYKIKKGTLLTKENFQKIKIECISIGIEDQFNNLEVE